MPQTHRTNGWLLLGAAATLACALSHHIPAAVQASQVAIVSTNFITSKDVRTLLHSAKLGVPDDEPMCLVILSGRFVFAGPPGQTNTFPIGIEVFDARTGHLLQSGGLPRAPEPPRGRLRPQRPRRDARIDGVSAPKHHTPQGFRNNYVVSVTKSLGDLLRWQFQRLRAGLPPAPLVPTPSQGPELEFIHRNAQLDEMTPAVTWIGHATALVQAGGLNVLTDPIFSRRASPVQFAGPVRAYPPGLRLDQLPHIDVVLISHNHYDHLDRDSVLALSHQSGGSPLFLTPLGLGSWLRGLGIENTKELDWWQHHKHRDVEFHCTPAQHWSGRGLHDRNRTLWCAWSMLGADFHWFFSGDTGYSQDFVDTRRYFADRQGAEQGGGFDLALIAVGACLPRWFMSMQHVDLAEAVQVHLDLGAKRTIGVHWGTFSLADEPLDQPIHELDAARREKNVAEADFCIMPIGGTRRFSPRGVLT